MKTITFDNGTKNTEHIYIRDEFDIETYFCDPYASWQKILVENLNKFVIQYFPKITDKKIYQMQEKLKNKPITKLNYKSANQVGLEQIDNGAINHLNFSI